MARNYSGEALKHIEEKYRELLEESVQSYIVIAPTVSGRKAVSMLLRKAGCENVFEEKNGIIALARAQGIKGDVTFLTELNLGDMHITELIRRLRSGERFAHSKVILITGETREQLLQPARDAGIAAYLVLDPLTAATCL